MRMHLYKDSLIGRTLRTTSGCTRQRGSGTHCLPRYMRTRKTGGGYIEQLAGARDWLINGLVWNSDRSGAYVRLAGIKHPPFMLDLIMLSRSSGSSQHVSNRHLAVVQ
jgi:hypothetical protein